MSKSAPFALFAGTSLALTQVPGQASAVETMHETHAAHHGPNIVEFFLGATNADHRGHNETVFSLGAQYRYAINPTVSVGVLAEYANDPLDLWVVGIPFVFNLGDTNWQLTAMPGAEIEDSHEEFLFRAGIGYEFEMTGYSLKPEINVDWVDGEAAFVGGVSIGFRF